MSKTAEERIYEHGFKDGYAEGMREMYERVMDAINGISVKNEDPVTIPAGVASGPVVPSYANEAEETRYAGVITYANGHESYYCEECNTPLTRETACTTESGQILCDPCHGASLS